MLFVTYVDSRGENSSSFQILHEINKPVTLTCWEKTIKTNVIFGQCGSDANVKINLERTNI